MGCLCCKEDEETKERKQSELPDNWNPNRVAIINSKTKIQVLNEKIEQVQADGNVMAVSTKGLSPQLQPNQVQVLGDCLKTNDGSLNYGDAYELNLIDKKLFIVCLPIWKGGNFNEKQLLKSALTKLVKLIKSSSISQIVINEVAIQYFGYPRQLIFDELLHSFSMFLYEETYLEKIIYASVDKPTVTLIEQKLKNVYPELFTEQVKEKPSARKSIVKENDLTSDLEQPLLD